MFGPSLHNLGLREHFCEYSDFFSIHFLTKKLLQGIKEGWYDGGSIAFAVILVIVVTGIILAL